MGETDLQIGTPELSDADDYATVILADGSEVEVYGDGTVYLLLNRGDAEPTRIINLYDNETEI